MGGREASETNQSASWNGIYEVEYSQFPIIGAIEDGVFGVDYPSRRQIVGTKHQWIKIPEWRTEEEEQQEEEGHGRKMTPKWTGGTKKIWERQENDVNEELWTSILFNKSCCTIYIYTRVITERSVKLTEKDSWDKLVR